ncbi:MAG: hypothetical protein MI919_12425, partial [Holophagales bacterium]|nr:hypothetical protein [Holophagales bacterium]
MSAPDRRGAADPAAAGEGGAEPLPDVWDGPGVGERTDPAEIFPDVWPGSGQEEKGGGRVPRPGAGRETAGESAAAAPDAAAEAAYSELVRGSGVVYGGEGAYGGGAYGGDRAYGGDGGEAGTARRPPPRRTPPAEPEEPSIATRFTSHVVVPAATIAMVSALLFFLFDLRSVFLPGAGPLKWVGFCFAAATVLIARYGRAEGGAGGAAAYSALLVAATVLAMALSPWEAPGVGLWGPLSNGVIILGVWLYARRLTERLSADLDAPRPPPPWLYGLERLEMEAARGSGPEPRASIYEIGRRRAAGRPTSPADGEKAVRDVGRLAVAGLLIFALGEPVLLAGPPEVGERALGAMVIFLLACGLVLAAASTVHDRQRLWAYGVPPGLGGVVPRVSASVLLLVLVLSLAFGAPGLRYEGRGELRPLDARTGERTERGTGDGSERASGADAGSEPGRSEAEQLSEQGADSGNPAETDDGRGIRPSRVVGLFTELGSWLRWPVAALLLLLAAYATWRNRQALFAWLSRWPALGLARGLRRAAGRWWSLLRRRWRAPGGGRAHAPDPPSRAEAL